MLKLRDWHISVPEGGVTVGFEGDNLMYRLEIDSDLGPEWLVKLDIQRGGAWDIIALEREGTKLYVDLTREMLGRHGAYTAQIRGMNGELEAHSERFYLRVRESVNALEGFPPCLPTELRQVEEKMEKMLETAETMGDDRYLKLTGGEIWDGNSGKSVLITQDSILAYEETGLCGEIFAGGIGVGGPILWIDIGQYTGGMYMVDQETGASAMLIPGLMELTDNSGHSVQIVSTAEGMQVLGNNSVYGLRDPEREDAAATKRYVDNTFLPRNGGVILEPESGYQINIMEPVEEYFTLPFEVWDNFSECMTGVGTGYIIFHDKKNNEWLIAESNDGRFLFYKLDQDKNTVPVVLTGVAAPEDDSDAVNKGYVDDTVAAAVGDIAAVLDAINGEVI